MTFIVSQTITYRRLLRFGFDVLESGKFKCQSETRQRDAPWCILLYTWGFNVARLPLTGRFPEPQYVKRAEERLHVLYRFWLFTYLFISVKEANGYQKTKAKWSFGVKSTV